MRFTLSTTALSTRLGILSKVLNNKSTTPILNSFLFEIADGTLTITASDNENVMKSRLPLDETDGDGRFTVVSTTMINAVKELPEQPITIEVDSEAHTIRLSYQNGVYNFTTTNEEDYPEVLTIEDDTCDITIPSSVLSDNISRSIFATANEELRPVMNGIYFDLTAEALAIVASDGHKLVRNKVYNIKSEQPLSFVLPKKPATLLKNVLAKDESDVLIRLDSHVADIIFGDSQLRCRLIEGRYPNYNAVIPQDNPNIVTMDRKLLLGMLKRVLPFSSDNSGLVRIHIEAGKLVVSSEDIDFSTSAKEEIVCDYVGTSMNIGFKGSSMVEILSSLDSDDVRLEIADPSRPCLILPEQQPENTEVVALTMPMLLND